MTASHSFCFPPILGLPMQMFVVDLSNLFHAFHEPGKLFKLSPLIVGGLDRNIDLDRFFYDGHSRLLLTTWFFMMSSITVSSVQARSQPGDFGLSRRACCCPQSVCFPHIP